MKQLMRYGLVLMMSTCLILLGGCNTQDLQTPTSVESSKSSLTSNTNQVKDEMTKITIYVPRQDGKGVMPQPVTIDKSRKTVKDAINFMIDQDSRAEYPVFAKGTKVIETSKSGDIVTIVMNDPFLHDAVGLTASLRLAAIVNTAVEFDGVNKVYVKVKNVTLPTYGEIDLTKPLQQMKTKIVK